ncbi:hypothetical protein AOLI_G00153140 [Acnodon oligacanthus]
MVMDEKEEQILLPGQMGFIIKHQHTIEKPLFCSEPCLIGQDAEDVREMIHCIMNSAFMSRGGHEGELGESGIVSGTDQSGLTSGLAPPPPEWRERQRPLEPLTDPVTDGILRSPSVAVRRRGFVSEDFFSARRVRVQPSEQMKGVWVMMLFLHCALSEKFNVVGPVAPVVATSGSDVVLPCSVQRTADRSRLSAVDLSITWTRSDLGDALVHFYENHKDVNTRQIPNYRARTALFKEELQNGNVSLRLTDVSLRDEGEYRCRVDSEFWRDEVSFNLRVEVIGESPVISVKSYSSNSEEFSLLCESKGWRPQPDLQLLSSKGENQTAGVPEIQRNSDLVNVKRLFTVHKNHIDTFYCRATLGEHMKEKEIRPGVLYERGSGEEDTISEGSRTGRGG